MCSELAGLREELARCKADKEFVWSLWKQLQKESPDVTNAISAALTREKNKQETIQEKLTATLRERDAEIEALKEELHDKENVINKLEAAKCTLEANNDQIETKRIANNQRLTGQLNKATDEVTRLRGVVVEKEEEIDQHLKAIEVLMRRAGELEKELKSTKTEAKHLCTVNTNYQETISELKKNEKVLSTKHMKEVDKLQREIKNVNEVLKHREEQWMMRRSEQQVEYVSEEHHQSVADDTEVKEQLEEEIKLLQLQVDKFAQENALLHNKTRELCNVIDKKEREVFEEKRLMKLMEVSLHTGGGVAGPTCHQELADVKDLLMRTEKELFDTKEQLRIKEEETFCIREKHEKRLERMKNLRESHELVLQQLKTYDIMAMNSPVKQVGKSPLRRNLRFEETNCSPELWNELTRYKTLYQETLHDKLKLEEDFDCMQVEQASYKSLIAELRTDLQRERNLLEIKKRRQETSEFTAGRLGEEHIEHLELVNDKLTADKEKLTGDNRKLSNECHQLKVQVTELQNSVVMLRQTIETERHRHTSRLRTTSTMTDCIPTTDSTTQMEPLSSEEDGRVIRVWSSISTLISSSDCYKSSCCCGSKKKRTRRHTDGQLYLTDPRRGCDILTDKQNQSTQIPPVMEPSVCNVCGAGGKQVGAVIRKQRSKSVQPHGTHQRIIKGTRKGGLQQQYGSGGKHGDTVLGSLKSTAVNATGEHRCTWQGKVKNYQQKLKSMSKQMTLLTIAKTSLTKALEEQEMKDRKQEEHLKGLLERNNNLKSTIQTLRNENKTLASVCSELRGKCEGLESMGMKALQDKHTRDTALVDENKKLKEEKKALNEKVSGLLNEVKCIQNELNQRKTLCQDLQQKITNMERDLKQKRSLITDQRKRLSLLEDQRIGDKEKINTLMSQVDSLQTSLEHFKQRVNSLKTQSELFSKEKRSLKAELLTYQKQLDSMSTELNNVQSECRKKNQQFTLLKKTAEKRNDDDRKEYQLAMIDLEREVETGQSLIAEYRELLMDLAKEISLVLHQSLKRKSVDEKSPVKMKPDVFQKARYIAQATFNLSDVEADEFMMGGANKGGADRWRHYYKEPGPPLASRVGILLNANDSQVPREQILSEFSTCVQSLLLLNSS